MSISILLGLIKGSKKCLNDYFSEPKWCFLFPMDERGYGGQIPEALAKHTILLPSLPCL